MKLEGHTKPGRYKRMVDASVLRVLLDNWQRKTLLILAA